MLFERVAHLDSGHVALGSGAAKVFGLLVFIPNKYTKYISRNLRPQSLQ